ncbi:MAG: 3-dehydroquinate synthase, partial [Actinomycetota bacterium]|nr:3-dehydroquinate synthase [Actinomycetota bacterium]
MTAIGTYCATDEGFHVQGQETVDFNLRYVDGIFDPARTELAESYGYLGRCLMIVDETVHDLYADRIDAYFESHGIALTAVP